MRRLEDRVAIVTGAGRGIGRATAVRLASEGASVIVNDIDGPPAEETAALIRDAGGDVHVVVADTVDMERAYHLVAEAVATFGKLDIVVNNAGTSRDEMFHRMTDELLDLVLDVNLKTSFHTTLAAMPYLREVAKQERDERGSVRYHRKVTFTASASALTGNPGQYNYTAAKGALIATTRTIARELAPFGVNVNAVAPGFIDTRLTRPKEPGAALGIPAALRQKLIADVPMGRAGLAEDVAAAHAFLVSPDADYITGVTLPVAGGMVGTT